MYIHERDSKRKIYVVYFGFWGLRSQTLTGAPPLDPAGGPYPLIFGPKGPQPLTPATPLFTRLGLSFGTRQNRQESSAPWRIKSKKSP